MITSCRCRRWQDRGVAMMENIPKQRWGTSCRRPRCRCFRLGWGIRWASCRDSPLRERAYGKPQKAASQQESKAKIDSLMFFELSFSFVSKWAGIQWTHAICTKTTARTAVIFIVTRVVEDAEILLGDLLFVLIFWISMRVMESGWLESLERCLR